MPLESQPHFVCESVQQQHRLSPGCVNFVPLHRGTGESTQTEVIDGTKLPTVPGQEKKQTSQWALIYFCPGAYVEYLLGRG